MADEMLGNLQLGSLQWEDEAGDLIDVYSDGIYLVFDMLGQCGSDFALEKTYCLKFIDPYGDTIFNQLQIPVLIEELQSLLQYCQTHEKYEDFVALIDFIGKAKDVVHTYINFYGD